MLYSWVLQLLKQQTLDAELVMPEPVAANLFRMLSDGLFGFENARSVPLQSPSIKLQLLHAHAASGVFDAVM